MEETRMKKIYKILTIAIAVIILYIACNAVSIYTFSLKYQKCRADVAIILGASTGGGEVSPVYRERINHGITLYREGYVDKLIVTGGVGKGNDQSDAYVAKQYAVSQGIPAYSSPTPTSRYVSLKTKIPFLVRETFFYIGYKWWRLLT